MLRFFSKIRYKLAAENKVGKYIRYAVGEILLVVIGILIALQVNNWNIERIQKKQENFYLNQLLDDFRKNLAEAKSEVMFSDFQTNNAELLLKSLNEPLNGEESERWFYALTQVWYLPHSNYVNNSWEVLKSTGNINLITNKEIVQNISTFYALVDRLNVLENEWGEFNIEYRGKVNNILDHQLRKNILHAIDFNYVQNPISDLPNTEPYISQLKTIDGIMGLISDIQLNRSVGSTYHNQLHDICEFIIESLSDELTQ